MRQYLILLFISTLLIANPTYAWNDPANSGKKSNKINSLVSRAANCTPATGKKFLEFNKPVLASSVLQTALKLPHLITHP